MGTSDHPELGFDLHAPMGNLTLHNAHRECDFSVALYYSRHRGTLQNGQLRENIISPLLKVQQNHCCSQ